MNEPTLTDTEREALAEAREYARTYWQHGQEPRSQWALTVLAEAVDRERAAWATKVEALAADAERQGRESLNRTFGGAWMPTAITPTQVRGLLAADDTEGPTCREVVESLDPFYTSWGGRAADDTEGKP